jgi:hypothetical protein
VKLFGHRAAKSREEVEREMRSLGWWYQHFELPNGVWTGDGNPPAYDPHDRWNAFEPYLPADLSGKTALDVGGNSGFFAIQMMLRGAKRVVLVEPFKEFTDQARFAADQFGVKLEIVNADVHTYCLTTEERFDYVLFLGLFYHLKISGARARPARRDDEGAIRAPVTQRRARERRAAGAAGSGERHRRPALPSAGVRSRCGSTRRSGAS